MHLSCDQNVDDTNKMTLLVRRKCRIEQVVDDD